ncbi:Protein of unknown function [Saccharicrinis carchari]|uniref:DUF2851 domain-containing protein n=1 Tax=Saccharicrinis carchari TaxID=1168039 RepID=A0A521ACL2_SACCC|nr:DUF2851 family protein [Saccharicrinis carchari]SMO32535.1 Protein of unknown function [Saccharicrinis carchari]
MTEEFIHYIWYYKKYNSLPLRTECNQEIEVINPGESNNHAGPDFFNAKIKIGGTLWAGNVEVHIRASDWFEHMHQTDKAYDNVILHVVEVSDATIKRSNGEPIPVLKLQCPVRLYREYLRLKSSVQWLACAGKLHNINPLEISLWLQRMLVERLEYKMYNIQRILDQTTQNWDETFYRLLFRSFGFGVNGDPFALLAQSIPLKVLLKYSDKLPLLEALLFGQAGFLMGDFKDAYLISLKKDYRFLQQKHGLHPIEVHLWRFLRLRPSNFPTIRIAQLAALLVELKGVFGRLINNARLKDIEHLLEVNVSEYWREHYVMQKKSDKKNKSLGSNSKNGIIINTIVPYLFAFGTITGNQTVVKRALDWLINLKAENNSVLDKWKEQNIKVNNAGDSQALIYLSNNYCKPKKCLRCSIGHKVLTIKNTE